MTPRLLFLGMLVAFPTQATVNEWNFTALLDGREIGYHRFVLTERDGARELTSEARYDVKFLFFNAYRYVHRADERWRGGCLDGVDARTDDNGTASTVNGRAAATGFVVETQEGAAVLPGCVMTFAYWNPEMLRASRLLNAQTGEHVAVRIEPLGVEPIRVRGTEVPARRYALRAGEIAIDLWYSDGHEWLALQSVTAGGRRLRYEIR